VEEAVAAQGVEGAEAATVAEEPVAARAAVAARADLTEEPRVAHRVGAEEL